MHVSAKHDVIVIGGGPSGMMAAGRAAERGKSVLLIEKNVKTGAKLDISGGGRCNITNAEEDIRALLANYGDAEQFLYSPFSKFSNTDTFKFFESLGLPLVVEARKRAFPVTQKAPDVTRAMNEYMEKHGVTIVTGVAVRSLETRDGKVVAVNTSDGSRYEADTFIVSTGGRSHPETGSTGEGFTWLEALGHTIHASNPSLVPIAVEDEWVKKLSGTSLSFMKITFFIDGRRAFSKTGKILFTHFGLSGPLILNSAKQIGELLREGSVTATIDMYPDTDQASLEKKILSELDNNKNKNFKNILDLIVPHGLDDAVMELLSLADPEIKVHSFSKEDRSRLVRLMKAMPVSVKGLMGFDRAVISDGGVPLSEVDTRTMGSKICPNLFLVGDILHVNRPSGGFSLQLCWTTGWVAGSHA
jgi:predicted Rossmann fold flavoprotein